MWEFLQAYGTWIVFGLVFVLMMRMCGSGGGGCGMGHSHQPHNRDTAHPRTDGVPPEGPTMAGGTSWRDEPWKTPAGCHGGEGR